MLIYDNRKSSSKTRNTIREQCKQKRIKKFLKYYFNNTKRATTGMKRIKKPRKAQTTNGS